MSFLSLKRLLPTGKVWKIFTNKLQVKLHKLNTSKAIEKPKMQLYKTSKKLSWRFLSIQPKKFKLKPKPHTLIHLNKITPPVYVDRLFMDAVSTARERMHQQPAAFKQGTSNKKSSNLKRNGGLYHKSYPPKTRKEGVTVISHQKPIEADDMWESLALASPQTQGIDERAEEFIARFRAQMHQQEMLARHFSYPV